ncbi:hypothetical protein GF325_06195 [Candidatus Bathyarchaeota archaeon]|nr:hypothetical protein [Candidatus Bathyarchaeota archaeon]
MVRLIFGLTRVQDAGKKTGTPSAPAKGTPAPSMSLRGPKPSQAKVPAVKPSKPRPPTTPSPGQKPPSKGKGELGKSSATLFKMKDEIGKDGKKVLDKEEKQPFSPKTPPELEDKKKKKKKK